MALEHGTPTAPHWYVTIEMARDWGVPAWEVTGDDDRLTWYLRYRAVYNIRCEVMNNARKSRDSSRSKR